MKKNYKLSDADYKLLNIIWEEEPIESPELCKLANQILKWKKSTTYTVLRRLCEKKAAKNDNTIVTSIIKKKQIYKQESSKIIKKKFDNSLPKFIAAFLENEKISDKEAEEIKKLVEEYRRNKNE